MEWWMWLITSLSALALFFLNSYTSREAARAARKEEEKKKSDAMIDQINKQVEINKQIQKQKEAANKPWPQ